MVTKPGTYLEADESPVEFEDAVAVWAPAAYAALRETATRYRSTMTYKELGEAVQRDTGIRSRTTLAKWIVPVLAGVARECLDHKEPLLIALCVTADGSVAAARSRRISTSTPPASGSTATASTVPSCPPTVGHRC